MVEDAARFPALADHDAGNLDLVVTWRASRLRQHRDSDDALWVLCCGPLVQV